MATQVLMVEEDCTLTHEGKSFTNGGAFLTEEYAVGYLDENNVLTNWHGEKIGTYRITSTWKTPRSYLSDVMCQVYATIRGMTFTGRSGGIGLLFKGKRVASELK